ncbi:VOC family protein [Paenibacillus guangzhouensis]|uniref:VOC family protein n=1 Tax=Paenibacillus guangzhouensis TaxID=1473112 RepID=UPI0012669D2A|nr:hypothetical protein [Paenibacillus guangzhouensis]
MRIKQLKLRTTKLHEMREFYLTFLQMPLLEQTTTSFTVRAGNTMLTFEQGTEDPFYHYAFIVNAANFDELLGRIPTFTPLLVDNEGETLFFSGLWQRSQAYFKDPQGNILEILPSTEMYPPDQTWIKVQEIGVVVADINDLITVIQNVKNIYMNTSDRMAFYGDEEGVFVLVKAGRHWFPTNEPAISSPIEVLIDEDLVEGKVLGIVFG